MFPKCSPAQSRRPICCSGSAREDWPAGWQPVRGSHAREGSSGNRRAWARPQWCIEEVRCRIGTSWSWREAYWSRCSPPWWTGCTGRRTSHSRCASYELFAPSGNICEQVCAGNRKVDRTLPKRAGIWSNQASSASHFSFAGEVWWENVWASVLLRLLASKNKVVARASIAYKLKDCHLCFRRRKRAACPRYFVAPRSKRKGAWPLPHLCATTTTSFHFS